MTEQQFAALVVDDEPALRRLTASSLRRRNFHCDEAQNGQDACEALARRQYDLVVTDLRMPLRNGHALAVDLLSRGADRPAIVVFTGVLEPRLVEDLIARGVDDVTFKPVDFGAFCAKVRALCERHALQRELARAQIAAAEPAAASAAACELEPLTLDLIEQRLDSLAGELPVSSVAMEIVNLAQDPVSSTKAIARLLARDPPLSIELLRLANSSALCPHGERIEDLQQAIVRVGHHQIAALAMAATAQRAMAAASLPWLDNRLLAARSQASGLAIGHLHPAAEVGADEEGLLLSSLLLPLSRQLLGQAFPDLYPRWIAHCQQARCALASLERRLLPVPPPRAIAGLLARWNLSPKLFKPLQHSGQPYAEIATLTEPLRSKVERLRVAELIGQLAIGRFEPWDEILFPPPETMSRLRAEDLGAIVEWVRAEVSGPLAEIPFDASKSETEIPYFKLSVETYDWLETFVQCLGYRTRRLPREEACRARPALVNSLNVSEERLRWFLDDSVPESGRSLVCSGPLPQHTESWGRAVELPACFPILASAVSRAAGLVEA